MVVGTTTKAMGRVTGNVDRLTCGGDGISSIYSFIFIMHSRFVENLCDFKKDKNVWASGGLSDIFPSQA